MKNLDLTTMTVDRRGTGLIEAITDALHRVAHSCNDDTKGDVGSVSVRLSCKALGTGEVAIKPEITANPAKHHLATRTVIVKLQTLQVESTRQLDFNDLELAAKEKAKEAKGEAYDEDDDEEERPPAHA